MNENGQKGKGLYDYIEQLETLGAQVSNIDNANYSSVRNFDISFEAGKAEEIMPILTSMMEHFQLDINVSTYGSQ